ncbi:MAG: lysophospholipid acyltransferase family protein [Pseudomonadota bacterium]|nr:lysophospholipid acyltransferase family protein [Pseudomonadota bacterium]
MLKTFIAWPVGRLIAGWLLAATVRLIKATMRWRVLHEARRDAILARPGPVILAFWHNRLMMMVALGTFGRQVVLLQSRHRDGQLASAAIRRFGITTIWGSTAKGGASALRALIRAGRAGDWIALTPDGPRGPRMRCQPGIVMLAQRTGAPVVPVTWSSSRRELLSTWDKMIIAWPFGGGVLSWGEPIEVPRDLDSEAVEDYRRRIETALTALGDEADAAVGVAPIAPDDSEAPP